MAAEFGELAEALTQAIRVPAAASGIEQVFSRVWASGFSTMRPTRQAAAVHWRATLEELSRDYPLAISELQEIAFEYGPKPAPRNPAPSVTATGPRSVAVGGSIGVAITGDNSTYAAGDHVDFRDSTFHDRVVGVQHNHYGTVPAPAEWRPVEQVEPLEFGVRPTRHVPGLSDVPPYVSRDCDDVLRAVLVPKGLVLILGESCVGKSYTAWQGVRSLVGHRLYVPDPGEDLRPVLTALKGRPGKYVVWLDELTDHLGDGGLDPRLLGRLTSLGAVVLGTMSPDEYYRRRRGTAPGERVVADARTVELGRDWSAAELDRLARLEDPRAYPAYMWSGAEGVASYFAVGHHLFDEWRRVGTQLEHPRGQLLVRAAVDIARCGVGGVSAELLGKVQEHYRAEERESFEDAFAWATTPMFGVSGLLVPGDEGDTWRAYGALVAEAVGSGDLEPVPDGVWWTLLDAFRGQGSAPDFRTVLDAARTAMQPRIEAGDLDVVLGLARRAEGEEREAWLRMAAKSGHLPSQVELARIMEDRGDEDRALRYLELAATAGSTEAAARLGSLLRRRAERWLRTAAEAGDWTAAHELADMLAGTGREGEAIRWLRRAAIAGHREVAGSLGTLLSRWWAEEAKGHDWLRYAVAWGDARAASELGAQLSWRTDCDMAEVERLYRQAVDGGDADATRNLGIWWEGQGRSDEAMALYQQALGQGVTDTEDLIAELLRKQGRTAEAEEWFRRAAEANPPDLLESLPKPPGHPATDPPDTVDE
ncbi:tetratricopeptide repeat protein [Streptomyces sp. CA-249302]|uniref:tetratricopeptide repeat protein n=1 Tax=Streptomyces sp. CA-249302 TaxID=3240058 RepID=UPI003D8FF600